MRRLVDSILFVLVAYTVSWPVVRHFVPAEASSSVAVELRGELSKDMALRLAIDEESALGGRWLETILGPQESATFQVAGVAPRDRVWVAVQLGDRLLPPYPIDVQRSEAGAHACVDIAFHDNESDSADGSSGR
ncbi:MAG: hypothetical protein AB7I19_07240 [Planctomycetota bacterium]